VEATKFTEVGYHGRDVDSIVRDLVEVSINLVKQRCKRAAAKRVRAGAMSLPALLLPDMLLPSVLPLLLPALLLLLLQMLTGHVVCTMMNNTFTWPTKMYSVEFATCRECQDALMLLPPK
jgi:hypothetical protein